MILCLINNMAFTYILQIQPIYILKLLHVYCVYVCYLSGIIGNHELDCHYQKISDVFLSGGCGVKKNTYFISKYHIPFLVLLSSFLWALGPKAAFKMCARGLHSRIHFNKRIGLDECVWELGLRFLLTYALVMGLLYVLIK